MANPNPPPPPTENQWKAGQSGNPGGRPVGSRVRLSAQFVHALEKDFDEHGKQAIKDAREKDPVRYVQIVASLEPKQIQQLGPLEDVTDAELLALVAFLRSRVAGNTGAGTSKAPESQTTQ